MTSTPQAPHTPHTSSAPRAAKALRYLGGGLLIGGFWYLNRHRPLWEEAVRTIAVFTVVMFLVRARLKRASVSVHLAPLIASKAVLVVAAALVEESIRHSVGHPALLVAAGLGLAVALLGPLGDGYFFSRRQPGPVARPVQHVR